MATPRPATHSAKIFFKKVVAPIFFNQPANDAEIKKAADEDLPPLFDYLESQLGSGAFVVGRQFSIGDIGIATQFVNLRLAGFGVDPSRWPKLAKYVAGVHERPSFAALIAEEMDVGETLVTVEFHDLGAATEVVVTHELFPSEAARDQHQQGWSGCLDHLAESV